MTATGITQEQLGHFKDFVQAMVEQYGIVGNKAYNAFLEAIRMQHGDPATASDETRVKRFWVEISTGTVALVDTAGAYSGTDFNASRVPHEENYLLSQWGATYSLAERNIGKLTHFIQTIQSTEEGVRSAARRFSAEGYEELIKKELLAKIAAKVKTDLETFLAAATTATVYGDVVIANTGTLLNIDNLETGGFDADMLKTLVDKLQVQQDYHGNDLMSTEPAYFLVSSEKYSDVVEIVKKSRTVNDLDRTILDYTGGEAALVVSVKGQTAGDVFCVTGDSPIVFLSETPETVIKIGFDKLGNLTMRAYLIYVFGWKGRNGIILVRA